MLNLYKHDMYRLQMLFRGIWRASPPAIYSMHHWKARNWPGDEATLYSMLFLFCLFSKVIFFSSNSWFPQKMIHHKWRDSSRDVALLQRERERERERERRRRRGDKVRDITFQIPWTYLNSMWEAAMSESPYPNGGHSCLGKSNWLCHPKISIVNPTHSCCHIEGRHTLKRRKYSDNIGVVVYNINSYSHIPMPFPGSWIFKVAHRLLMYLFSML